MYMYVHIHIHVCTDIHVRTAYVLSLMQARNVIHSTLLQLELPNMVDSGESEGDKLKTITHRYTCMYMYIHTCTCMYICACTCNVYLALWHILDQSAK